MSFGTLYGYESNPRTMIVRAIAKENKLDIELEETNASTDTFPPNYLELNPLGLVPTFVGADGFTLTEVMAIAIYFTSQNEKTTLLGKNKEEYASILRWMSMANSYLLPKLAGWFRPLIGRDPYNKGSVEKSKGEALKGFAVLEKHLLSHTYLVSERLTLADLFVACITTRGFDTVFDKEFREKFPCLTRWYSTITAQPIYTGVAKAPAFRDEAIQYVAPKKEPKPKKEAAPAAPKAKPKQPEPEDDDEEAAPAAPKAKHPLESLEKPNMVMDDWKRKYSNEDPPVALAWFWENCSLDKDYSLYRVDYKDNEKLTLTFMSSNLIGGFFARLEGSRKFLFGCCSVYGVANDSVIQGAFLVRGQDVVPAFDVAPDMDSYDFTKLDPKSSKDKEFVESMWSWEKPVEVKGKKYEWADGKVFK